MFIVRQNFAGVYYLDRFIVIPSKTNARLMNLENQLLQVFDVDGSSVLLEPLSCVNGSLYELALVFGKQKPPLKKQMFLKSIF